MVQTAGAALWQHLLWARGRHVGSRVHLCRCAHKLFPGEALECRNAASVMVDTRQHAHWADGRVVNPDGSTRTPCGK
jgi:hypothetical protein